MLKYIEKNIMKGSEYRSNLKLELHGIDLSTDMIQIAKTIVPEARLHMGNMLDMRSKANDQYHLILNNFAMHHATAKQAEVAIRDYESVLVPNGCLFFSAWEGEGPIDYGDMDMNATLHSEQTIKKWVAQAGLTILHYRSFIEEEMGNMNSLYVIAQKK